MKKDLVVITGASSGIGEACAKLFSEAGYPLLLLARRLDRLQKLNLKNVLCEKCDVTDLESFKKAIEKAEKQFGPVEYLINNAGVLYLGKGESQDPVEWKNTLDVNVMGVLHGIHLLLKKFVARNSGTIVNIGSVAGRRAFPDYSVYCASKFAVHALTESIRAEVAEHNVRMITIAPGIVETEIFDHSTDLKLKEQFIDFKNTIKKALIPDDIARSILFAIQQSQYMCIREMVICPTAQID